MCCHFYYISVLFLPLSAVFLQHSVVHERPRLVHPRPDSDSPMRCDAMKLTRPANGQKSNRGVALLAHFSDHPKIILQNSQSQHLGPTLTENADHPTKHPPVPPPQTGAPKTHTAAARQLLIYFTLGRLNN